MTQKNIWYPSPVPTASPRYCPPSASACLSVCLSVFCHTFLLLPVPFTSFFQLCILFSPLSILYAFCSETRVYFNKNIGSELRCIER